MTIILKDNTEFKGFVNVAGVTQDTSVVEANKLIEAFVAQLNAGALNVEAFKSKEGKWVIGFR